jgi:hypothetical protein
MGYVYILIFNLILITLAAKVQTALKLSQDDRNTITSLRAEVQKAWKMVDSSHEKELRAKETIGQLKMEITNLSKLVEAGAGLSVGQENTVKELLKVNLEKNMRNGDNERRLQILFHSTFLCIICRDLMI